MTTAVQTTINITQIIETAVGQAFSADRPPSIEQIGLATLAHIVPPEVMADLEAASLLAQTLAVPPDTIDQDQIVFRALTMSVPA